ncbi:PepSY-associated TM helix domain-containing protein [Scleromatobacter humisilvae]|uniref:PepSY-associated TM helix domain-containing protein n=1 Tax=Scleromatobacter humisilvae TaxID=2897159 RepID=A0A9X1YKS3_9BURK|nr:PepSY-associated TM helix domain-containing protein [Scleromatobacter humisilvae]MCK9686182.1 PepSY-associated TM helix domain-containing protein [Scleromatobacter humisilvae]
MERHLISPARATAVIWLRKTHGWIGLWGATLGLLFGFSGIWLNHRAVLPLKPAAERDNSRLALPDPRPADAHAMAAWLQSALSLPEPAGNVRTEKARPAPWAEASASAAAMQPEHWTFNFGAPRVQIQAEYWVGNDAVSVRRTDNGVVATLTNLHKGIGMPVAWILLVDTLAGSMILLSLSGLALWMLTRRRRTVGLAIFGTALAVTAGLAIAHL